MFISKNQTNMKKKVKLYEVREDSLVYAISFVENPAIESDFIYLSSDEPIHQIYLEQDEKHIVYGAVLIPNKPIYRRSANEEFYIKFPQSSIEQLAHNYLMDGYNQSFTEHHQFDVEDVSIIESWVKLSEADKSVGLGLNVPNGSWLVGVKVNNEALWNDIKNGTVKGFSVESFLNFDKIMSNKIEETNMNDETKELIEVSESFWVKIATIIKEALKNPEVPELEAQVTAAQVVDDMKEDVVIENPTTDEVVPTTDEPTVVETPIADEEPTEVVEETTEPEVIAEEVVTEVVEETETTNEAKEDLQIVIDELNKKIAELNSKIEELEKENVKLSKQPSTKPLNIKANLSSDSSAFDRMLAVMNGSAFSK